MSGFVFDVLRTKRNGFSWIELKLVRDFSLTRGFDENARLRAYDSANIQEN
jgi:hypothetical protein